MNKPYIGYIVVPAVFRPTLQALAVQLGDGGAAESLNFGIGFCLASDPNTIVAYGGSTGPISQEVIDYVEKNVIPNLPSGAFWMRCENIQHPSPVLKTNYKSAQDRIDAGQSVVFDLGKILTDIGMIMYSPAP